MKPGIVLLFSLLISSFGFSQQDRIVKGRVYDSSHISLQGATILLYKKTGGDTLKSVTDKFGQFVFTKVLSSAFSIRVTNVGMEDAEQDYDFEAGKLEINIGSITMQPAIKTLQEVLITPPPIVVKEDTVEFKADSFKGKTQLVRRRIA